MPTRPPSRPILSPWQRPLVEALLIGFVAVGGAGLFLLTSGGASVPATWALLIHLAAGALLVPVLLVFALPHAWTQLRRRPVIGLTGAVVLAVVLSVALTGGILALERSAVRADWVWPLHVYGGFGLVALYALHRRFGTNPAPWARLALGAFLPVLLAAGLFAWERAAPALGREQAALAAAQEEQPFLPSLATTEAGGYLQDSTVVRDVATCGECHARITDEWRRSAHRHASFTNPFYKGTILAMRKTYPLKDTRWCAGCHDPALLFTGKMHRADLDVENDPDARVGLTCVSCHAIEPRSILGNGDYVVKDRKVYAWEKSGDPRVVAAHDVLLKAKPDDHAASMRPHNIHQGEFCSLCHKAEVPAELNRWKWFRAQNEYDGWHDSGVSLNNVRSFYHPPEARRCQDCHMPLVVDANDPAADAQGLVRSHLFPAANTALPWLRGDEETIELTRQQLRTACRVDVTGVVLEPREGEAKPRLFAPAWRAAPAVRPGEVVEAHVVVRNQGVGHPFPGGTIDSNEVWVRFEAGVGDGEPFYVSGAIDAATGRVDPSAEFFRSYVMDRHGRRVVNRIGPDIYTRVYVNRIGPGTATVVRYRFRVPEDAAGPLRVKATLRYRKFMREYVDFLFPDSTLLLHRLDDGSLRTVDLADLPIVDMAEGTLELPVQAAAVPAGAPDPAAVADGKADLFRLNDLGIAYLLQGDPYGALPLFEAVTRIDPSYADGWVNVGRAHIAANAWDEALAALAEARKVHPGFAKARFFEGQVRSALADWPAAERAYRQVLRDWPLERQALRSLAEALYEQDRYAEALQTVERLFAIDPEDAAGWFWAVRCHDQLGDAEASRSAREAFEKYRDDDDEPQRAGRFQIADENLLRLSQPIHVHTQEERAR